MTSTPEDSAQRVGGSFRGETARAWTATAVTTWSSQHVDVARLK